MRPIKVMATQEAADVLFKGKRVLGWQTGICRDPLQTRVRIQGQKSVRTYSKSFWEVANRSNKFDLPQRLVDLIYTQDFSKRSNVEWVVAEAFEMGRKARG